MKYVTLSLALQYSIWWCNSVSKIISQPFPYQNEATYSNNTNQGVSGVTDSRHTHIDKQYNFQTLKRLQAHTHTQKEKSSLCRTEPWISLPFRVKQTQEKEKLLSLYTNATAWPNFLINLHMHTNKLVFNTKTVPLLPVKELLCNQIYNVLVCALFQQHLLCYTILHFYHI